MGHMKQLSVHFGSITSGLVKNFLMLSINAFSDSLELDFVTGDIDISEIEKYLTPKPAVTGLEMGSLVEIVEGPFKGERAKITAIDAAKEEVTVQLIESMVPIPVTVKAEAIRNMDKT